MWDLVQMQIDNNEYIHEVSVPICKKLFSYEQLLVLYQQQINTGIRPTIYFDATGSVVRKPFHETNRVYLYIVVISLAETERVFPVFEMVYYAKTIFKIFRHFRVFCEESKKKAGIWKSSH